MPKIMINICRKKFCKHRRSCVKHTKKRCSKKKEKNRRKTNKAIKTLYVVTRIKINPSYVRRKHPSIRIRPRVNRYFFVAPQDMDLSNGIHISSNQFIDDSGETVNAFSDIGKEGYVNLFINGVLQEGGMYRVKPNALTIAAAGQNITAGTPIIIESVGFTAKLIYK